MNSPLLRCFALYRYQAGGLTAFLLITALVQLTGPAVQDLMGMAFDELVRGEAVRVTAAGIDAARAWWWAGLLLAANTARGVVGYLGTVVGQAVSQRLLSDLRDRILTQVQRLDLAWHVRHGAGEVVTRTTRDSDKVRDAVTGGFRQVVEMAFAVIASVIALGLHHWLLGVVPLLTITVALVFTISQAARLVELDRQVGDSYDRVTQDLSEGVVGARVIKAFALEPARSARFASAVDGFVREANAALRYTALRIPVPQLIVASAHVWVLACGAWLVAEGRMTSGGLLASVMIMQALVFRVEPLGRLLQTFADARSSAGRIVELLDAVPAVQDGGQPLPERPFGLRWRGIVVGNVLRGVDLELHPGEVVALVGATGSGKSVLAGLAPRLADPDAGAVEIGSAQHGWQDVRTLDLGALRRAVQVVPQESFLFSVSVAENLRLADPSADDERLHRVLAAAAADEVVAGLPDGLAGRLGERGVTLSGGQRQRLCLARALLARPAVFIADDATSALDALTEQRVMAGLQRECGSAAVLLIASKLSTLRLAQRIAVLHEGRIVASGTHDGLLATSAAYRDLLGIEP